MLKQEVSDHQALSELMIVGVDIGQEPREFLDMYDLHSAPKVMLFRAGKPPLEAPVSVLSYPALKAWVSSHLGPRVKYLSNHKDAESLLVEHEAIVFGFFPSFDPERDLVPLFEHVTKFSVWDVVVAYSFETEVGAFFHLESADSVAVIEFSSENQPVVRALYEGDLRDVLSLSSFVRFNRFPQLVQVDEASFVSLLDSEFPSLLLVGHGALSDAAMEFLSSRADVEYVRSQGVLVGIVDVGAPSKLSLRISRLLGGVSRESFQASSSKVVLLNRLSQYHMMSSPVSSVHLRAFVDAFTAGALSAYIRSSRVTNQLRNNLASGQLSLVLTYTPWCYSCIEWLDFFERETRTNASLAAYQISLLPVDVSQFDLPESLGLQTSVPRVFLAGKTGVLQYPYKGARAEVIVQWIRDQLVEEVVEPHTETDHEL